ncbi:MAG: aminoacyl-tRNA hydrolase [Candidatus Krumholzibacteriia bacterium]
MLHLVIGLGNPGARYAGNRHNVGFRVVDELARRAGVALARVPGRYAVAEVASGADRWILLEPLTYMNRSGEAVRSWAARTGVRVTGAPVGLPTDAGPASLAAGQDAGVGDGAAPDTGAGAVAGTGAEAADPALPAGKGEETADPALAGGVRPVVVCDDLSLPLGAVRIRARGSAGGQKGLASLIRTLGGEEFPRVRLGVGDPQREIAPADWADYVLSDFEPAQEEAVSEMVIHAADAVTMLLERGVNTAASRCNRRQPPGDRSEPDDR